jgi:uncharacterized membrane protein
MVRTVVGGPVGVLAVVACLACSDSVAPVPSAVAPDAVGRSQAAGLPPLAYGVHTSVLPGLDGYYTNGFNDWGEVVGETGPSDSVSVAFHWQLQRGTTSLTLAGTEGSAAAGVTDDGEVAVNVFDPGARYVVARWPWSGSPQLLPLLSDWSLPLPDSQPNCFAAAINIQHVVLGYCTVIGLSQEVITTWSAYGRPAPLMLAGSTVLQGFPSALSDEGVAVGREITSAGTEVAFAYNLTTHATTTLPVPAGTTFSGAYAVNDSGWVAGSTSIGCGHAAAWLTGATFHDIPVCGVASGIANDGTVVGVAIDSVTNAQYAFVWTADSGVRELPGVTAHDFSSQAIAINRVHQALGIVNEAGGVQHTVMWTFPSVSARPSISLTNRQR